MSAGAAASPLETRVSPAQADQELVATATSWDGVGNGVQDGEATGAPVS